MIEHNITKGNNMKVLHILSSNKFSGAENVVCQIISMFDNDIEMAYCSPDGPIKETLANKNITFIPLEKLNLKNIKKAVKEFKPDIIHCHDFKAIILGSFIKNVYKVGHIHTNKVEMHSFNLKSILVKHFFKKFDQLVWVSTSSYAEFYFKNKVATKSSILPNIISVEKLISNANLSDDTKNYDVLYLGRMCYEKDPIRLATILASLIKTNPTIKCGVIGDGYMMEDFKNALKNYEVEGKIDVLGFMSNPYKILQSSKCLLMTSNLEGTPMCAIEAISLGVPVISTKTGGMNDLIKNDINGYLYDTNEEAQKCILELLKNENKLMQLKESSKQFGANYNKVEEYKSKLSKIYRGEK